MLTFRVFWWVFLVYLFGLIKMHLYGNDKKSWLNFHMDNLEVISHRDYFLFFKNSFALYVEDFFAPLLNFTIELNLFTGSSERAGTGKKRLETLNWLSPPVLWEGRGHCGYRTEASVPLPSSLQVAGAPSRIPAVTPSSRSRG